MTIEKVCLLVDWNMYDVLRHFSKKFAEALDRKGIITQIIDAKREPLKAEMFYHFETDPPDITCSFNNFEKLPSGKFIWDVLQVPHISFTLDPTLYFLELTQSPYSILSSVDRSELAALQTQFDRAFLMPHGIEPDITFDEKADRPHQVVFFGSCFDYEGWQRHWKKTFPQPLWSVLDQAIDLVLTNNTISLADALASAWGASASSLDPQLAQDYLLVMFHYLNRYVRGRDRVELIRSIKDAEVHVYGEVPPDTIEHVPDWTHYLGNQSNVVLHPPVSFTESLEILKKSKICLNSMPFFRNGTHERVFAGAACGALVLSSESLYLRETLKDGEDILFYRSKHWHEVNDLINKYLSDPKKLKDAAMSGRKKVLTHHTWDNRVDEMLKAVPPMMEKIKS